jgi:hypothetical protein
MQSTGSDPRPVFLRNGKNLRSAIGFISGITPGILRASLYLGLTYITLFMGKATCQGACPGEYWERVWVNNSDHSKLYCISNTSDCASCNDYCCKSCGTYCAGYSLSMSCAYVCPAPPDNLTASGSINCSMGEGGWCRGSASLGLMATDSLGHTVSFTGMINGMGFSCGAPCTQPLPEGSGSFSWAAKCTGGKTVSGSGTYKVDGTPPVLTAGLSGGMAGKRGWYWAGPVTLACSASDSGSGFASLYYGNQNATGQGSTTLSCAASDVAGNTTTASNVVNIDSGAPSASIAYSASPAASGWFTKPVTVSLQASDDVSGIYSAAISVNGGGWVASQTLNDGSYRIEGAAEDYAGHTAGASGSANVDSNPPVTAWTIDSGRWVRGEVKLSGVSSDATSGIASVYISFDGKIWNRIGSNSQWSYLWDTTQVHNGTYLIEARADDVAGNQEHTASVILNVDNTPPQVSLAPDWLAGTPGNAKGNDIGSWIARVRVTISKPGMSPWVSEYTKMPDSIQWDQTDGLGVNAGYGDFDVLVEVWDAAGNYDSTHGTIHNLAPTKISRPTSPAAIIQKSTTMKQSAGQPAVGGDKPAAMEEGAPLETGNIALPRTIPFWPLVLPIVGMGVWLAASSVAITRDRRWDELRGIRRAVELYRDQKKVNFPTGEEDD